MSDASAALWLGTWVVPVVGAWVVLAGLYFLVHDYLPDSGGGRP